MTRCAGEPPTTAALEPQHALGLAAAVMLICGQSGTKAVRRGFAPDERICSYASNPGFSRRRNACALLPFDGDWTSRSDCALCRCNARSKAGSLRNSLPQNDRCSRRWPSGLRMAVISRPLMSAELARAGRGRRSRFLDDGNRSTRVVSLLVPDPEPYPGQGRGASVTGLGALPRLRVDRGSSAT